MTPWTAASQASLSFTISLSLLKLMSFGSANHLILVTPFSFWWIFLLLKDGFSYSCKGALIIWESHLICEKAIRKKDVRIYNIRHSGIYTHILRDVGRIAPSEIQARHNLGRKEAQKHTWTREHILSRGAGRIIVYQTGKASYNVNDNFFFFFFKISVFYLFIFWLCWIFTAAHRLSLAVVSSALCTST